MSIEFEQRFSNLIHWKAVLESGMLPMEAAVGRAHMDEVYGEGREAFACEDARIKLKEAREELKSVNSQLAELDTEIRAAQLEEIDALTNGDPVAWGKAAIRERKNSL